MLIVVKECTMVKGEVVIKTSYTALSLLKRCPRLYYYTVELGLQAPTVDISKVFGEAVHAGWGCLYDTSNVESAIGAFRKKFPFGVEDPKGLRTQAKGEELIRAYQEQFFGKEEWVDEGGEVLEELELAPGINYRVKIDRRGLSYGEPAIQEWKTTAWAGFFVPEPNAQLIGYLWADSVLRKRAVRKCIVTIGGLYKTSKNGIMPARRKRDEYGELGGGEERSIFSRDPVYFQDWQIEEWKEETLTWIGVAETYKAMEIWPQASPEACGGFGGCAYKQICLETGEERKLLMEVKYEKKERS